MSEKDPNRYDDIIDLPRYVSKNRKHMSNYERAAQFAPFAALTGYDESISEAGRLTEEFVEPGEQRKTELNRKFSIINEHIKEKPEVRIEYFVQDLYKEGGEYVSGTFRVYRLDLFDRLLITTDRKKIELDYISDIDSELFDKYPIE